MKKVVYLAILIALGLLVYFFISKKPPAESYYPVELDAALSQIRPNMSQADVVSILSGYFPGTKSRPGPWSGQTGYVDFDITPNCWISISFYNAPNDFESKYVHEAMTTYIHNRQLKLRIDKTGSGNATIHRY